MTATLYDTDLADWARQQANLLRRRRFDALDLEHLAEEVESLGRSELRALHAHLARLIEHVLKLELSPASDPRSGWKASVRGHRYEVNAILEESPSLKASLDLGRAYKIGAKLAAEGLNDYDGDTTQPVPQNCPYTTEDLLADAWFPKNRFGLD